VATEDVPLLHDPPDVASLKSTVDPTQSDTGLPGVIAAGVLFTVTTADTEQAPTVYITVSTPDDMPVTVPPTTDAVLLVADHTPPEVGSVSVTVLPVHTVADEGDIAAGAVTTVTVAVAKQAPIE